MSPLRGATFTASSAREAGSAAASSWAVSAAISAWRSFRRWASTSALSSARATSWLSLAVFDAPRMAVPARVTVEELSFLRPVNAVRIAMRKARKAAHFDCFACSFSRSTRPAAVRIRSSRVATFGA